MTVFAAVTNLGTLKSNISTGRVSWADHYANLKRFNTGKPQIVEGLIWGSLMAATLKRYLACCTPALFHVQISTRKVAMCSVHVLANIVKALFYPHKTGLADAIEKALHYFKNNARRAHPKRDRLDGRLKIGLVPYFGEA